MCIRDRSSVLQSFQQIAILRTSLFPATAHFTHTGPLVPVCAIAFYGLNKGLSGGFKNNTANVKLYNFLQLTKIKANMH